MAPEASRRLTSSKSFDRIEGETPKAFEAFVTYRNLGPDRTLEKTVEALNRVSGYYRVLAEWSSDWNWVERARSFDSYIEARALRIAEGFLPMWEERRQAALERMMFLALKLLARGETMLDHPTTKEITKESADGRTVYHIIEPAGWSWGAIATVIKTGAELQAAVIAEGLAESQDDAFDVESATPEELRAYLDKTRRRKA